MIVYFAVVLHYFILKIVKNNAKNSGIILSSN